MLTVAGVPANTLFLLAAIVNLAGWGVYLRNQWTGSIQSRPAGWLLSTLLVLNGAISSTEIAHTSWAGLMYAAGVIPCMTALVLASRRSFCATRKEKILISAALVGLLGIHRFPGLIVIIAAGYYGVTYSLFAVNVWTRRAYEKPLPWMIWGCAAVLQLCAIRDIHSSASILPATNLVCWLTVAGLAYYRQSDRQSRAPARQT